MTSTASVRPPLGLVLGSLLRADIAVLRRSWRQQMLSLGLPLVVLGASWLQRHGKPPDVDFAATLVGIAITAGPLAAGVMGYPLIIARDRESGVFQRLRVTPAPNWTIMASRLVLHLVVYIVVAVIVATLGAIAYGLPLGVVPYLLLIPAAIIAGAVFLSIGQAMAGLLTSATLINAVGRVVLVALYLVGGLGLTGGAGTTFETVARWSPMGSTEELFHATLVHTGWTTADTHAMLACLGYILVFSILGIRCFRWDAR
ncbi:ABC transporter permease [Actinocrispum wychmicini]|uniref:ABC-2 type transport system permease protein n=1 Tax=Actinocrispum wychmicini TaxID=1213861 RepID=A0A4R2JLT4_9PSEU|nr:ABC transporter permease [Actinocrispum wychmicini]TCO59562.1 ABC-2 type transport system permease protein [Actinocrispum wychmicini]